MTGALTAVPPAFAFLALAVVGLAFSRRVGHTLSVVGALGVCAWLLTAPAGVHVETRLFGFRAVLFNVDIYSRLVGVTFGFIAAVGVAYAHLTGGDRRQTALALAYVGAGLGAVFAGDWLTLVVGWELMAVFATALIWYRSSDRAIGIRYAIYHEIGGLVLIAGVLLHYVEVGSFLYSATAGIVPGLPAALAAVGIGLNAGFLGLHVWLVDSYPRTHVATSVVLAAVTTKVAAYAIVRAFPGGNVAIAYVGGAMVLFGVTFAILQTDMRRLLSYHVISQVGYIVAGFGAGAALADAGALAHLVNHVFYKALLFMIAGIIIQRTGAEKLKQFGGLAREMPITALLFAVAAFSIVGIPGFNGFVSKGMILDGVQKAELEFLWYVLVIGGVGTVISFSKFGYYAFIHDQSEEDHDDISPLGMGTLGSLAALCILLGILPVLLFDLLPSAGVAYAKPFKATQFTKTAAVVTTGVIVFVGIRERLSHLTPIPDLDAVYHPLGRRVRDRSVAVASAIEDGIENIGRAPDVAGRYLTEYLADRVRSGRTLSSHSRRSIGGGLLAVALALVLVVIAVLL